MKTAPAEERVLERIKLQKTVNAVVLLRDTLISQEIMFTQLAAKIGEHVDFTEGDGRFTPHQEPPA